MKWGVSDGRTGLGARTERRKVGFVVNLAITNEQPLRLDAHASRVMAIEESERDEACRAFGIMVSVLVSTRGEEGRPSGRHDCFPTLGTLVGRQTGCCLQRTSIERTLAPLMTGSWAGFSQFDLVPRIGESHSSLTSG
jgi:hypothetical protein